MITQVATGIDAAKLTIPEELLEQFERGNVLLFIGEDFVRRSDGTSEMDELAERMATRLGISEIEDYTFPELAQVFEDEHGRHALVQFVRDYLDSLGDEPTEIHRLVARLHDCKVLVTTLLDNRLQRAFEETGNPLDVIIGKTDLAFEDERKTDIYMLRGSSERPDTLVLTEDDYETFFDDQESISVVLQGFFVRRTILFLGYDLSDPHFKRLYRKVTATLDTFARRAYGFGNSLDTRARQWCKRHGIVVGEAQAADFLPALVQMLDERLRPTPVTTAAISDIQPASIPERPYKLLDYYSTSDESIFFGREQETLHLTSLIHAHRMVLLYGPSGVGKTSLLYAGVFPRLERADPGYKIITVRALEDPSVTIRNTLRRWLPQVDLPENGSLMEFLSFSITHLEGPLVIVLDQFEEFFIRLGSHLRETFIAELGSIHDARDIPVKFVISLREDWLASMSEVEERIPEVFRNKFRLMPLTRAQAYQAITAPVERLGMAYEPDLVETLFDDLLEEKTEEGAGIASESVITPHLQLICNALYEHAVSGDRRRITMADYEAVGKTRGILNRYLLSAIQEHPGEEKEIARHILISQVTSQKTKALVQSDAMIATAGAEPEIVQRVLSRLVRQRLIRPLSDGRAYELSHDVLASTISNWISDEDRQLKQVMEMLQRELLDWKETPSALLSASKFDRINTFRDQLQLTDETTGYILRTSIFFGQDISYWLARLNSQELRTEVLLEMLGNEDRQARLNAIQNLENPMEEQLVTGLVHCALEDPEAQVRDSAAVCLGRKKSNLGVQMLSESLTSTDPHIKQNALYALALVSDQDPGLTANVPKPDHQKVNRTLAKIRFQRDWLKNRRITVAGAIGGAVGFGLGLSLPITLNDLGIHDFEITALLFFALFMAVMGLPAGAGLAFGISAGATLSPNRANFGRIIGGVIFGGIGFSLALLIPLLARIADQPLVLVGSFLFGVFIALGTTIPHMFTSNRWVAIVGGMVGAILGSLVFGLSGFAPFSINNAANLLTLLMLLSAGILGFSLAFSIERASAR